MSSQDSFEHIACFWNTIPSSGASQQLERPHRWNTHKLRQLSRMEIAVLGESIVAAWAQKAGWSEVGRQIRGRGYELDLVVKRDSEFRVIEVKTRLFPIREPDFNITTNWLSISKQCSMTRGAKELISKGQMSARGTISAELFAVDILKDQRLRVYRWPDVFQMS